MRAMKSALSFWLPIFVAATLLSVAPNLTAQPQSAEDGRIRGVLQLFFDSFQRKDLDSLMGLWSERSPERTAARHHLEQQFAAVGDIALDALAVRKIETNGGTAVVLLTAEISAVDRKSGKPATGFGKINRLVELVKEDGQWRVLRYVSAEEDLAARLVAAKTEEARNMLLSANSLLKTAELDRSLAEAAVQASTKSEYPQILAILRLAERLSTDLGDQPNLANIFRLMGVLQSSHGFYEQALASYQKSVAVSESIGDDAKLVAAINGVGVTYTLLGNYALALRNYRRGLELARQLGDKSRIARFMDNIGYIQHEESDYDDAMKSYQEGLRAGEESGDAGVLTELAVNMGILLTDEGDYPQALALFRRSLKTSEEAGRQDVISKILIDIARVEDFQGNTRLSSDYYKRALDLSQKMDDKQAVAYCLAGIAQTDLEQGMYSDAATVVKQAIAVGEQIGEKVITAASLGVLGLVRNQEGKYGEALECFQKALKLDTELADKSGRAARLADIGDTYNSLGKFAEAVDAANQSAAIAEQIGYPAYLVNALVVEARAYRAMGIAGKAQDALNKSISITESLRNRLVGAATEREHFLESQIATYHEMVDLLLDQKRESEAFSAAEQSKARTLTDALETSRVNVTKAMTPDERIREHEVNAKLGSLNLKLIREKQSDNPDPARLAELERDLQKAQLEQETFQTDLYSAHPEIRIQRGDFQPLSLEQATEVIPDLHTVLLEFVVSKDRTDVFVLTRQTISQDIPTLASWSLNIKEAVLTDTIERFCQRLARRDPTSRELSIELYNMLIRPVSTQLAKKTNLIVVPDAALWELPFQALQPSSNHYMVETYTISYAPSVTAIREMYSLRRAASPAQVRFVAFANPLLGNKVSKEREDASMNASLQPLPQAEAQARSIAKMFGANRSKIYVGPDATEDRLKSLTENFDELYIAAHGIVNNANPMYSQIILSRAQASEEDGVLEAWEVVNMNLKANLVVLSACSTAGGRVGAGEGMIGLSWAFFIAGCPAVAASQWDVDADATTALMIEFHRGMLAGKSRAEALRQAELRLLKGQKYTDPFYWAPFVIVGDAR